MNFNFKNLKLNNPTPLPQLTISERSEGYHTTVRTVYGEVPNALVAILINNKAFGLMEIKNDSRTKIACLIDIN